jgi:hypothetical protein
MLTLIVYGLICGAHDVKAIWQKCAPLDQNQRRAIGLTKRNKKTGLLTMPGYGALNDLVNRIDPVELARAPPATYLHHLGTPHARTLQNRPKPPLKISFPCGTGTLRTQIYQIGRFQDSRPWCHLSP